MGIKVTKGSMPVQGGGKVIAAGARKNPKTTKKISAKKFVAKHDPNVVG